jgi:hypothetical protein
VADAAMKLHPYDLDNSSDKFRVQSFFSHAGIPKKSASAITLKNLFATASDLEDSFGEDAGQQDNEKAVNVTEEAMRRKWFEKNCDLPPTIIPIAMRYEKGITILFDFYKKNHHHGKAATFEQLSSTQKGMKLEDITHCFSDFAVYPSVISKGMLNAKFREVMNGQKITHLGQFITILALVSNESLSKKEVVNLEISSRFYIFQSEISSQSKILHEDISSRFNIFQRNIQSVKILQEERSIQSKYCKEESSQSKHYNQKYPVSQNIAARNIQPVKI